MNNPVRITRDADVACIVLDRPASANALDEHLIESLHVAFDAIAPLSEISTVVLSGAGKSLCAGADISWMQRSAALDREQNIAGVMALGRMLKALDDMPQTTIARVHGPVYGGGIGLICACDVAIGTADSTFCFSEVRLGLVPGMISPYALRAVGAREARRYFQTAEVIDAAEAKRIGLLHEVVEAERLDEHLAGLLHRLKSAAPAARAGAKMLVGEVDGRPVDTSLMSALAARFADARVGAEGREGLAAFLEKRKPRWT